MRANLKRLILAALLLTASTSYAEQTLDSLIEILGERIAAISSLHQEVVMTVSFGDEDEFDGMEQQSSMRFQRPDRLLIESDMATIVSDGTTLAVVFTQFDYVIRKELETGLSDIFDDQMELLGGAALPDVMALLSDQPAEMLRETAADFEIEILGEETFEGRSAWALRVQIEDDEVTLPEGLRIWIDQETGLFIGLRARVDLGDMQHPVMEDMPSYYDMTYTVNIVSVNEEIRDDYFVLDVEGLTEVASFEELLQSIQESGGLGGAETVQAGERAPDFSLTLMDGTEFQLSEQQGNVVLIDFWATWCPPCVESLPYLQGLYEEFEDDEVVFVGVSLDRPGSEQRVENMIERFGLTYLIGINEDGQIANEYGAVSIPTLVVVDAEGIVRHTKIGFSAAGMQEVRAMIRELADSE